MHVVVAFPILNECNAIERTICLFQTASSRHGAEDRAVEAPPGSTGDLQSAPGERPELLSGGTPHSVLVVFLLHCLALGDLNSQLF